MREKINQLDLPMREDTEQQYKPEVFFTGDFESPRRIKAKSGNIALATDKGPKSANQDALVLDIEHDSFAVIDGMGGETGAATARIVAEAIRDDFKKQEIDTVSLHHQAYLRMNEEKNQAELEGRKEATSYYGAVYLAGRIESNGKELTIYQAGDCRLIVIDRKGKIKYFSTPTELSEVPDPYDHGRAEVVKGIGIKDYDYIIAASDGLWKNVEAEEVAQIVVKVKVEVALKNLADLAKKRMADDTYSPEQYGQNRDNITVFIYQILPESLCGK